MISKKIASSLEPFVLMLGGVLTIIPNIALFNEFLPIGAFNIDRSLGNVSFLDLTSWTILNIPGSNVVNFCTDWFSFSLNRNS